MQHEPNCQTCRYSHEEAKPYIAGVVDVVHLYCELLNAPAPGKCEKYSYEPGTKEDPE